MKGIIRIASYRARQLRHTGTNCQPEFPVLPVAAQEDAGYGANPSHMLRALPTRSAPLRIALALCAVLFVEAGVDSLAAAEDTSIDWVKERQFWSFQPPRPSTAPKVRQSKWPKQPIDYFILAKLESSHIKPAPESDRRTLIRRLTLDLTGVPPTPAEVDVFAHDRSTDAYVNLVDRLLSSPRFGERMASMWLPLARYAEDQAHQVGNDTKSFYPNAWRYRDWVINAFNRDLPYDQFIRYQIAADKCGAAATNELAALGFLGLGHKYYNRGRLEVQADEWEDRVDTVSRATLGLTVACARCHDHKFEPITMRDYYALAGVFASTRMINLMPDGKAEADKTDAAKMNSGTLHVVQDGTAKNLNIFLRGNVEQPGPEVPRGFLQILAKGEPASFKDGSGRLELAESIVSRDNPLTARVMVNRVWALFFGRPLVLTPSNFGHSGQHPTHPELLDDLAARFMANGWSTRQLVRELVMSSTYRQASTTTAKSMTADPANEWLGRMNRKRLTIEQWRDSVLFVSGKLEETDRKSVELESPTNVHRTVYARISRLQLDDLLMQYDYPDANVHAEKRSVTVTPTQKLFVLNSPFMMTQAQALAERLSTMPEEKEASRIRAAYRLIFSREPEREELNLALGFLRQPPSEGISRWDQLAHMLLASNEFLYLD